MHAQEVTITKIEQIGEKTSFSGRIDNLELGKYKFNILLNQNVDGTLKLFTGNLDIKQKPNLAPPYNGFFSFDIDGNFNKNDYQSSAYIEKIPDQQPITQEKTCYASYKFKFICPESDTTSKTQITQQRQGLDIIFVMDKSETVAPIVANMKTATLNILKKLDSKIDRVGLVSFGEYGTKLVGLTNNFSLTENAINSWSAGAKTTNIADGIKKANDIFLGLQSNDRKKIMIIVSDGIANSSTLGECPDKESYPINANICTADALNQAKIAKSKGISVYTIGYNFAKTNAVRYNAGNFAKSLMGNIATNYSNFIESNELSTLFSAFDNIVKRNIVYLTRTIGGCSNVNITFNYRKLEDTKYDFQPKLSGPYKTFDSNGINWAFGDVNKQGEGSEFIVAIKTKSDVDFNNMLRMEGAGDFAIEYRNRLGLLKPIINYSNDDIITNSISNSNNINAIQDGSFSATVSSKGCDAIPEPVFTPDTNVIPDNPDDQGKDNPVIPPQDTEVPKISISRTIKPIDCNTAEIKLDIECKGKSGLCNRAFVSQYSDIYEIINNSLTLSTSNSVINCVIPSKQKIECNIPKNAMSAGQKHSIVFRVSILRGIDQDGNDISLEKPAIFYLGSSNNFVYYKDDLIYDVIKILGDYSATIDDCNGSQSNADLIVERSVASTAKCQEANVRVSIKCKNKNGCKGDLKISDYVQNSKILDQPIPTIDHQSISNYRKDNSIILSLKDNLLQSSFDYNQEILLDYNVKTDKGGTQTINTSNAKIEFIYRDTSKTPLTILIGQKESSIKPCDPDTNNDVNSGSEYSVIRTVSIVSCQKAKVKLEIKCNNSNGCSEFNISDYLPEGTKYISDKDEKMTLCLTPGSPINYGNKYMGGLVQCRVPKGTVKAGSPRINEYYISFDDSHIGEQTTNQTDKIAYLDSNNKPVKFSDSKVKVEACKSGIIVDAKAEPSSKCGVVKLSVHVSCNAEGTKNCPERLLLNHRLKQGWKVDEITSSLCKEYNGNIGCTPLSALEKDGELYFSYNLFISPSGEYNVFDNAYINYGNQTIKLDSQKFISPECENQTNFEFVCRVKPDVLKSKPNDIVLVLDDSGSMGINMDRLREAVVSLSNIIDSNDRIGIVRFSGYNQTKIIRSLREVTDSNRKYITDGLIADGLTNMYRGVELGLDLFKTARPNANKIMIIFSDGQPNEGKGGDSVNIVNQAYDQVNELLTSNKKLYDTVSTIYLKGYSELDLSKLKFVVQDIEEIVKSMREGMSSLKRGNNSIYLEYDSANNLNESMTKIFQTANQDVDQTKMICKNIKISAILPTGVSVVKSNLSTPKDLKNPAWDLDDMKHGESQTISIEFSLSNKSILQQAIKTFKYSYIDGFNNKYSGLLELKK